MWSQPPPKQCPPLMPCILLRENTNDTFLLHYSGVVARHPGYLPYLRAALTPEVVADYFSHLIDDNTPVERYSSTHDYTQVFVSH